MPGRAACRLFRFHHDADQAAHRPGHVTTTPGQPTRRLVPSAFKMEENLYFIIFLSNIYI
jgi:hypothetical protein